MSECRQRLSLRRLARGLGFAETRGLARGHQRHVFKPTEQFPADGRRIAVRGGQIEGDQLTAVGETMLDWRTRIRSRGATCCGRRAATWSCRCYAAALLTPLKSALLVPCKGCVVRPAAYVAFRGLSRKTCLAISRPIMLTSDTDASLKWCSTPPLWHIDAVGGASTPS